MKRNQTHMHMNKLLIGALAGLVFTIASVGIAMAHAAIVWAYVENNQVFVEAFYASGRKIQNAQVIVVNGKGESILEGKTDTQGKFSYKPLSKETQTIVVKAGESHVGDFEITAEDLAEVTLAK